MKRFFIISLCLLGFSLSKFDNQTLIDEAEKKYPGRYSGQTFIKIDASKETLLVLDGTTGQNAIMQVKAFKETTDITGIVLTKLDGTAKGGIVLAIKELVDIPVKFVGLGEKEDDMIPFDIEKYIYGLFKEF